MANSKKWLWFLIACLFGLCSCQVILSDSRAVFPDSASSSPDKKSDPLSLALPYTLAILPFDNLSSNARLHWLGRSLSEMLTHDLASAPTLSIIARDTMGSILREQWLQHQGFSSTVSPVKLGHLQGVRYLLRGGFYHHEHSLKVDVQVVDVETGIIIKSMSAQGQKSELPRIEHALVVQILNFFNTLYELPVPMVLNGGETDRHRDVIQHDVGKGEGIHPRRKNSFGKDSVHQLDLQLSLERMTQSRMEALGVAEAFWENGWSPEIGQPRYDFWESSYEKPKILPILSIPISLFMQASNILNVLEKARGEEYATNVNVELDGVSLKSTDDTGISHLFLRYLQQPRRLFVRALNTKGELMAVYSKWSWKTESIFQDTNPNRIYFPIWPQPLLSGVAEFPIAWVERDQQHMTFDMVMVPIPHEHLSIVLETVPTPGSIEHEDRMPMPEDASFLLPLKKWILSQWKPPITEALPVGGYLPANKRTVGVLLNLQDGKIVKVKLFNVPQDTLFSRSLEVLKQGLLGFCVRCENGAMGSSASSTQIIRLQLTLAQDFQAFHFGSPSS